jgi:hypothetical protein
MDEWWKVFQSTTRQLIKPATNSYDRDIGNIFRNLDRDFFLQWSTEPK